LSEVTKGRAKKSMSRDRAQTANESAQAVVVALDGLPIEDQEAVWWTVYRCIHDRQALYGLWSARMQTAWAAITLNGRETSALSDALQAVIRLVLLLESAERSDSQAARAHLASMAKAEDVVELARACLLIAQG